jgi:hypothetical protein
MIHTVLLWALPDSWTQYELLAPDLDAHVEQEMRRRFGGVCRDDRDLERVIAMQIESLQGFAADGIVLLATYGEGGSEEEEAPLGLILTLALANRPPSNAPELDSSSTISPIDPATVATEFASEATPLLLDDPDLTAFTCERRIEATVPGAHTPVRQFQAQAFVLPNDQIGMAVITVTAFHPASEDHARQAARDFAHTLCFVTTEDEGPKGMAEGE